MSEYHQINCELLQENEDALLKALKELGYNPEIHEKSVHLYGYEGTRREQMANIILPRSQVGAASNDIGFERLPNGKYNLHVSEFDSRRWKEFFPKLIKKYGIHTITKLTTTGDYSLVEYGIQQDGTIRIRVRVNEY